jgi:hypothetical protein
MTSACSRACRPAHATGSGPGVLALDVWPAAAADALLLVSVSVLVCQQQTATSRNVLRQVRQSRRGRRSSPRRVRGSAAARRRLTCAVFAFCSRKSSTSMSKVNHLHRLILTALWI